MIKIVWLEYIPKNGSPVWHTKCFRMYVAENGKSVCTIGDRIVTKDEGNQEFRDALSSANRYKSEVTYIEGDDNAVIQYLYKGIDPYTCYIENYKQQKEAERENEKIFAIIEAFRDVMLAQ